MQCFRSFTNIISLKCLQTYIPYNRCITRHFGASVILPPVRRNHYQLRLSLSNNKYLLQQRQSFTQSEKMAATWSMGPGTLQVPLSLFSKNRKRLAELLKSGQVVVLQGGDEVSFYDTDVQYNTFRQVRQRCRLDTVHCTAIIIA